MNGPEVGGEGARAARFAHIHWSVWLLLVSGIALAVEAAREHAPGFVFWLAGFYVGAGVVGFVVEWLELR